MIFRLLSALIVILTLSSCDYDNREDQTPKNQPCEPVNVSFIKDVQPILSVNCVSCHNQNGANGGITLDNYASVKLAAESGRLLGAIKHSPGFTPMPQGGTKLPDCEISKIEAWIKEGTLEN